MYGMSADPLAEWKELWFENQKPILWSQQHSNELHNISKLLSLSLIYFICNRNFFG